MKLTPKAASNDNAAVSPSSKKSGWRKAVSDEEGSAVSDLSSSSGELDDDPTFDKSEEFELFEKTLRTKHSKACKAMSVSRMR